MISVTSVKCLHITVFVIVQQYATVVSEREHDYELTISTNIGDLEWHNSHYFALFQQIL